MAQQPEPLTLSTLSTLMQEIDDSKVVDQKVELIRKLKTMDIPDYYLPNLMKFLLMQWGTLTDPSIKREILDVGKKLMKGNYSLCKNEFENLAYKGVNWCRKEAANEEAVASTLLGPKASNCKPVESAKGTEKDKDLIISYMCDLLDKMKPPEYKIGDKVEVLRGRDLFPAIYIGKAMKGYCKVRFTGLHEISNANQKDGPTIVHLRVGIVEEDKIVDHKRGSAIKHFIQDKDVDFKIDKDIWYHGRMKSVRENGNYNIEVFSKGSELYECQNDSPVTLLRAHKPFETRKRKRWDLDS